MNKLLLFFFMLLLASAGRAQHLSVGSDIGFSTVRLQASKHLALITRNRVGFETHWFKGWFIDFEPAWSQLRFTTSSPAGENNYHNIRSLELSASLRRFMKLSDKSFLYLSVGPYGSYFYNYQREEYPANRTIKDGWSSLNMSVAFSVGFRTHVLRRLWFDVASIQATDLLTPSQTDLKYIKTTRQALKLSFFIALGKNYKAPEKKNPIPMYYPGN